MSDDPKRGIPGLGQSPGAPSVIPLEKRPPPVEYHESPDWGVIWALICIPVIAAFLAVASISQVIAP